MTGRKPPVEPSTPVTPGVVEPAALTTADALVGRLAKIEALLERLVAERTVKDWYSTDEFAALVGKAGFTVREWCRHGRVRAEKRLSGRGAFPAWCVSHAELLRYQREGLLPARTRPVA